MKMDLFFLKAEELEEIHKKRIILVTALLL